MALAMASFQGLPRGEGRPGNEAMASPAAVNTESVLQALRNTPKGRLSYSPKWDRSSEAERRDLLAEFCSPSPLSPETAAYLTQRMTHLSLHPSPSPRNTSPTKTDFPRMKLKLEIEGDAPQSSSIITTSQQTVDINTTTFSKSETTITPTRTNLVGSFLHSTPIAVDAKCIATETAVVMEMSVLAEQEAGLREGERDLEEKLQREAIDRLEKRLAFIKEMEERVERQTEEDLEQSLARRRREEELKKAKLKASEMQWKQKIELEMERVAERYRQHGEELRAKLRAGLEQEREIAKRNEERRKQVQARLQQRCSAVQQECRGLLEKMNALLVSCAHRELLPEAASKAYQTGCQVLVAVQSNLQQQLHTLDEEQVAVLHSYVMSVHPLLAEVNSGVQEATQKGLQAEREKKRQQQQQQQQQNQQQKQQGPNEQQQKSQKSTTSSQQPQPPTVSSGSVTKTERKEGLLSTPMGISPSAMEIYSKLQEKLAQAASACEELTKDQNSKKYKFDLQKAISTPINAISGQSGEHLMDKIRRLSSVLSGRRVRVTGREVSACDHPQGRAYCFNLLARKIVRQGDEQVSSQSDAAFPVAKVMASLCVSFPELRDLILAYFHANCPVLVPFYASGKDLSHGDRCRLLGYKVNSDGEIEGEDSYLKRMSGIVRLYAAFLQTPTKPHPHPHGLEHGWAWLARVLNMEPHPSLTATAVYDMLEIAGHAMMREYRSQFQKMLYYICKDYIPCMEKVTPPAQQGPLTRLKLFLEKCIASGTIPQPKGLLGDDFWRAHSHGIATA